MERFPRGTLPPPAEIAARSQARPTPSTATASDGSMMSAGSADQRGVTAAEPQAPRCSADLASTCPVCNTLMQPEHAHYRCGTCGYRDSCCF